MTLRCFPQKAKTAHTFHVEQPESCACGFTGPVYSFVTIKGKRMCVRCAGCKEILRRNRVGQIPTRVRTYVEANDL